MTHRFSTPEGIEIEVQVTEHGTLPSEERFATDFIVYVNVPGHRVDDISFRPGKAELEIRTSREMH